VTRRPHIEDLTRLALPEEPALWPDGSQIVYVLCTAGPRPGTPRCGTGC